MSDLPPAVGMSTAGSIADIQLSATDTLNLLDC